MKALTVNRMSLMSLRRRRRSFRLLITGIIVSIYFVCTLALAVQGTIAASECNYRDRVGHQDGVIFDSGRLNKEVLLDNGLASEVGVIHMLARTEAGLNVGSLDEAAQRMLGRRCTEGRLPEQPGEIAIEPSALARMRLDAKVGDRITLSLSDAEGRQTAEADFTLTGLLSEQTRSQMSQGYYTSARYAGFPALLVSPGQTLLPLEAVGQHMLVRYAPGINAEGFTMGLGRHGYHSFVFLSYRNELMRDDAAQQQMSLMLVMGLALILTGCVGIANAFQTQMSERREQIGMMRAVGATRGQIRRIFVREALLIALISAPVALLLSWLTVTLLSRAMPETLILPRQPLNYLIALAASMLVVVLSALLPAFAGARVSPMQALRRIAVQRRMHRRRLRSQWQFRVPRLVARRSAQLYPARQLGLMLLIALVMWLATGAASSLPSFRSSLNYYNTRADYEIMPSGYSTSGRHYSYVRRTKGLTAADMRQIQQIPGVESTRWTETERVQLPLEAPTLYGSALAWNTIAAGNMNLAKGETLPVTDDELLRYLPGFQREGRLDKPQMLAEAELIALDADMIAALAPYLSAGFVDLGAINSGQQVILAAPDLYITDPYQLPLPPGVELIGTPPPQNERQYAANHYEPMEGTRILRTLANDQFKPGDPLSILQAYAFEEDGTMREGPELHYAFHRPALGGLIAGNVFQIAEKLNAMSLGYGVSVITSHEGLSAMGLYSDGLYEGEIRLSSGTSPETRRLITAELEQYVLRDPDLSLIDTQARSRELRANMLRGLATLGGVVLLLTALSISLMNASLSSRIRSQARTIGMLRAVGADLPHLRELYFRELINMVLPGMLLGTAACVYYVSTAWVLYKDILPFTIFVVLALLLVTLGASALHLNRLLRRVSREGIMASMREL